MSHWRFQQLVIQQLTIITLSVLFNEGKYGLSISLAKLVPRKTRTEIDE